jgi:hypothetical protein
MNGGVESQGMAGLELAFGHELGILAFAGVHRHADGSFDPRDAVAALTWTPVSRDTLLVRFLPGVNIPTGGVGNGIYTTPLSTASFDPFLTGDVVVGGTWLAGLTGVARVPLYAGWDQIRQGAFLRADLRGARRFGDVVPWLGLSGVRQLPSDPEGAVPSATELAATAGGVANLSARWSLTAQLRVSLFVTDDLPRQTSGGLTVRAVVGHPSDAHDHDDDHGLPATPGPETDS